MLPPTKKRYFVNVVIDGKPCVMAVGESVYKQLVLLADTPPTPLPWYRRFWRRLTNFLATIRNAIRVKPRNRSRTSV